MRPDLSQPISKLVLRSRETSLREAVKIRYDDRPLQQYIEKTHARTFRAVQNLVPTIPKKAWELITELIDGREGQHVWSLFSWETRKDKRLRKISKLLGAEALREAAEWIDLGDNKVRFYLFVQVGIGEVEAASVQIMMPVEYHLRRPDGSYSSNESFQLAALWDDHYTRWKLQVRVERIENL